ncbi:CHRNA7-FAM7A fusion protein-like [Saccostrea cucullata]|uniref:CHRNA7-FAM7A fusion protein-like n=1 Tax=Saccostrea cuccullata TaxID=36930 RepID=UPI002ED0FD39
MPIILMEILQMFVFLLPENSGDRVSFSVTILLSIAVYLTIVSEQIPKSSEPAISVLAIKLFADLCIGCVVQVFVIISQYTYTREKPEKREVQEIEKVNCCDPKIWAQKKDWTAIAYCLDITFAMVAVCAMLASNLYLFGSFM